jgi:DNA uptake protein ComE-like DNA-binding protein
MKKLKLMATFTRQQRTGIIALFLLMMLIQAGYYIWRSIDTRTIEERSKEEQEWLALQSKIDELKARKADKSATIYPFNPNFITDYKGYSLGMSLAEIDRLHKFRKKGQWINSAEDFKNVTGVHDTLLAKLSPYFKFPDWVKNKREQSKQGERQYVQYGNKEPKVYKSEENKIVQLDINEALEEDLDKVYGIGPAFAKKILRRRAQFGAFVSMEQMNDFEDFSPEAIAGLKKSFRVSGQPQVNKVNINTASLSQLSYFPYFNKSLAKAIITRRSMKGRINNIEELLEINDFPIDKQKIIALYLDF